MKYPISILHIMQDTFAQGGTPRKLLSLLLNNNHDEFRYIFLLFANNVKNLNQEYIEAGAIVEEVYRPHSCNAFFLWDILRICKKYRCDIITTHFARADLYGALAGFITRIPTIKYVHGIVWNDSIWLKKIDGLLSSLRACTVCNSDATRRAVISQTGAKNTRVIYNGIPSNVVCLTPNLKSIKRDELNLPCDGFIVIHVGGMIELRDQKIIIYALKRCIDKGVNAHLLFVGDGPLRDRLTRKSAELGLSQRIHFLGYRDDIAELNATSDVFVNMAREEGFGIAVVEAMQAGLPVVLADAGALPELIEDGKSGLLVPAGDSEALAESLIMISQRPEFARRMGEEARKRAIGNFSIQRYVKDMENVYLSVAEGDHVN